MSQENPFRDLDPAQNPYANFSTSASAGTSSSLAGGLISHVRIVSILMIVQGSLVVLLGIFMAVMGFVMPAIMQADPNFANTPNAPPMWIFPTIYGGLGFMLLVVGVLNILAGIRNYRFRSRGLGITAMSMGMAAALTCYCAPTAIGLLIYGLIVYLNPQVAAAFALAQQGYTPDQILAAVYSGKLPPVR